MTSALPEARQAEDRWSRPDCTLAARRARTSYQLSRCAPRLAWPNRDPARFCWQSGERSRRALGSAAARRPDLRYTLVEFMTLLSVVRLMR